MHNQRRDHGWPHFTCRTVRLEAFPRVAPIARRQKQAAKSSRLPFVGRSIWPSGADCIDELNEPLQRQRGQLLYGMLTYESNGMRRPHSGLALPQRGGNQNQFRDLTSRRTARAHFAANRRLFLNKPTDDFADLERRGTSDLRSSRQSPRCLGK